MNKTQIKFRIMSDLYYEPRIQINKIINKIVLKMAIDQGQPANGQYIVIYNGANFKSAENQWSWEYKPITYMTKYDEEFKTLYQMSSDLAREELMIRSHINQIFNNANNIIDFKYLLNPHLHDLITVYYKVKELESKVPSFLAIKHKKFIDEQEPNRDTIINERIITNMLIKGI